MDTTEVSIISFLALTVMTRPSGYSCVPAAKPIMTSGSDTLNSKHINRINWKSVCCAGEGMQESNRKTEIKEELEYLKKELKNFQQEKECVRAIIGQIGGVPKFHNMLFNWILIIATGTCLVKSR